MARYERLRRTGHVVFGVGVALVRRVRLLIMLDLMMRLGIGRNDLGMRSSGVLESTTRSDI